MKKTDYSEDVEIVKDTKFVVFVLVPASILIAAVLCMAFILG